MQMSGLESAKLKLVWAAAHIEAVRKAVRDYTADEPSGIARKSDGSHKLKYVEPPPPAISILAGETVYQIRSALDYVAFELVKLNPNRVALPVGWREKCAFPLRFKKKSPVSFDKTLPGITPKASTFIESVQPYHRRNPGKVLRMLAILSNIDKHRHLNLTKGQVLDRTINRGVPIHCVDGGTRLESFVTGHVRVQGSFQPFVSFNERTLGKGTAARSIEDVLQACLDTVEKDIIPVFEKLLKNP